MADSLKVDAIIPGKVVGDVLVLLPVVEVSVVDVVSIAPVVLVLVVVAVCSWLSILLK